MQDTFYWHDYETWGVSPSIDGPSQFAGVRTDMDLNIIGEPLVIYNQPALDRLPHPQACAITCITPQTALEQGVPEREFARLIHDELNQANTCSVGYNSFQFDDEVTRHMLYRNFYPVYDREWKQGNSRWDLIDVMRMCFALRPDGIEWPINEKGVISFKLEHLSKANGLLHEKAHDALSDVEATIALAKLLKETKPRLFDYAFKLRDKKKAAQQLDVFNRRPVLYTSAYFPVEQGCTSLVMPLATHPTNKNAIIALDLMHSPTDVLRADAHAIADNLYRKRDQRELSLPLVTIAINKSPMLSPVKLLDDTLQQRLNIDMEQCQQHAQAVLDADRALLDLKLSTVFKRTADSTDAVERVVDEQLYGGGFFSMQDVAHCETVQLADEAAWSTGLPMFQDERLNDLKWRYQARHFPHTLNTEQQAEWLAYCLNNPNAPVSAKELSVDEYIAHIDALPESHRHLQAPLRDWLVVREQIIQQRYG
ncbi:MAG: exodeoxyribonuclease I [Pseudomonadota bacterium]